MPGIADVLVRGATRTIRSGAVVVGAVRLLVSCAPVRVSGSSMEPSFHDGDLLAVRALCDDEPRAGQVVLAEVDGREVVKRVTARADDDVILQGDNRGASTDPGIVARTAVRAIVVARYWPLVRVG